MRRRGWLLAAALAITCSDEAPPPRGAPQPAPVSLARVPDVELRGCVHRDGPRCILEAGERGTASVWVWIDAEASAQIRAEADEQPIDFESRAVNGGQHAKLPVPRGAATLRLWGVEPTWPEPFVLELGWQSVPAVVTDARALEAQRGRDTAVELLERTLPSLEPVEQLAALQRLRKLVYGTDPAKSMRHAERAAALARSLGRDRDLADIAAALAHHATTTHAWERARRWIDEVERAGGAEPELQVWARNSRALLAEATGDRTTAARLLADVERQAARLGMIDIQVAAMQGRAVMLGELSRADDALAVVRRGMELADTLPLHCGAATRLLGNLGWAQLRLVQQGFDADVPWEAFERALARAQQECPSPVDAYNQRLNLVLAALADGELEDAHERYQQLLALPAYPPFEYWVDEVGARIALGRGQLDRVPSPLVRPRPAGELGLDWSIAVRRARQLARLGLRAAAIDVYTEAERMLDDAVATVGLDVGKEMFLASRSASAHGLVRELLGRGAVAEAACRARLARRRALQTVDRAARIAGLSPEERARWEDVSARFLQTRAQLQRQGGDDWSLSADQQDTQRRRRAERHQEATAALDDALRSLLAEPRGTRCDELPGWPADERMLMMTADDEGMLAFVGDASGAIDVVLVPSGPEPAAALGQALGPLVHRLDGAARIRVMSDGLERAARPSLVPLGDRTLLDLAPLVHTLDLSGHEPRALDARAALVIADPSEDLPQARQEADAVQRSLRAAGWTVRRSSGEGATRQAVIEAVDEATLLHYAGHGVHRGGGGWDAALLLHDGELGVTDLLAIERVPPAVVLTGCDTGSRSRGAWAGGINLGRAFVLAGASEVLVADGTLDETLARRAGEGLARQIAAQPLVDLPRALWAVQRELRAEEPDADWWRLRVLVP